MASTTEPIIHCLERNWEMIDSALAGMDDDMLSRAPADGCNSAAWILWHLSRVMDMFVHFRLQDAEQLWNKDGWADKFSIQPGIEDRGVGWTAEQVADWVPPSREVQEDYYRRRQGGDASLSRPRFGGRAGPRDRIAAPAATPHHRRLLRTGNVGQPCPRRADRLPARPVPGDGLAQVTGPPRARLSRACGLVPRAVPVGAVEQNGNRAVVL